MSDQTPAPGEATATLPPVLDPASAGRMFYFDKRDPRVLFGDIRELDEVVLTNGTHGRRYSVKPDQLMDFRALPFPDESFRVVIFDPPHSTRTGPTSWVGIKYGYLDPLTWRDDIRQGFAECFRVLEPGGVLIFKWAEADIKVREVLELTDQRPLVGHMSGKKMNTHWITFMKDAEEPSDG